MNPERRGCESLVFLHQPETIYSQHHNVDTYSCQQMINRFQLQLVNGSAAVALSH
jgi:hypothetical protein